jgi:hypothetical protein
MTLRDVIHTCKRIYCKHPGMPAIDFLLTLT